VERFLAQISVVQAAWMPFLLAVGIVAFGISKAIGWRNAGTIEALQHRLSLRDDQIENYRQKLERASLELAPVAHAPPPTITCQSAIPNASIQVEKGSAGEISPMALMSLYRKRTSMQADAATKEFLGKVITVEAFISDMKQHDDGIIVVFADIIPLTTETASDWMTMTSLFLYFREGHDRLIPFHKGDAIRVRGRLMSVDGWNIRLDECELLEARSQSA
jgi:hypothetical protein